MADGDEHATALSTTGMAPAAYYDTIGDEEWDRLAETPEGRIEFDRTTAVLSDVLPREGPVLDAGGGPGRYSIWLAERGHDVIHLDLSGEQVALASRQVREHGVADRVAPHRGDIRDLPFETDSFDGVCCLGGPLSHVLDPRDRETVLAELARVAAPGAPVVVSVIGLLNALRNGIRHGLEEHPDMLPKIAESGDYTAELVEEHGGDGWAECHFFRAAELEGLLEGAGLAVERMVGLEGPASSMGPEIEAADSEAEAAVRDLLGELSEDRGLADGSAHILAVGRA